MKIYFQVSVHHAVIQNNMKANRYGNTTGERESQFPLYQQVKRYIILKLQRGELQDGEKIESENTLVKKLKVSRMTVNRALRELAAEGKLIRVQGVGTFVAKEKPQSPLFEIQPIDQEIRDGGGKYSCDVYHLQEEKAKPELATIMGLAPYGSVYHSIIIHKSTGEPFQLADRFVNPAIAGDYLEQDFTRITPSEYLLSLFPVSEVEHVIESLIPDAWIRNLLQINAAEPCLLLHRKTWVGEKIATYSNFYYPGSRHRIGGRFKTGKGGCILTA